MEIVNEIDKNKNQVLCSNNLIEAKYKLGVIEQKIIHRILTQINIQDKELKFFKIYIKDFCDLLGNTNNYKIIINNACENLRKTDIWIETDNETEIKTTWFSSAEYFSDGTVELEISRKLSPYLLELKRNFTKYDFSNIINFKSQYSIRLYQLLKQYDKIGKRDILLDELKEYFQIENEYKKYANFKQKILNIAQKEINSLSDISFAFEEIKKGRKVDKIKFYIIANKKEKEGKQSSKTRKLKEEKEKQEQRESDVDLDDLIDQLREIIKEPLRTKEYKSILQAAGNNIELIKQKYQIAQKQRKIDNLVGWLIAAIQEEYTEPVEKKSEKNLEKIKNSRFNNIESREYDYEDLERQLLNKGDC